MGAGRKHQVGSRLEAEIAEMGAWMRARGVKESSVLSYSSRLREFATWYRGRKGGGVTAQAVTARVLKEYERYLRRKFDAWAQVVSRLSAVRSYNRWAVATGRLAEEDSLVVRTVSKQKPRLKKRRPSEELYDGVEAFDGWLKDRGRSLATIQAQGYMLRSIGRWCLGKGLGKLTPAIATPALLNEYWRSSGRSEHTKSQGSYSLHNYVLWGIEAGKVSEDPFAEVLERRRPGSSGAWTLISASERDAFLAWVAEMSGIGMEAAREKVGGVSRFWRWFYFTRRAKIRREDATPETLEAYRRYLDQIDRPPRKRRLLSGSTINSYMHAARWFVRWASSGAE